MKRACLTFLLLATTALQAALPERVRVLSCELDGGIPIRTAKGELTAAGTQLRDLLNRANADIICVQGAADWENCSQLADLKEGYRVLICSAFPITEASKGRGQVGIIARDRAVLSWSEQVTGEQGFAFAIVQAGARKLGIFSIQDTKSVAVADRVATEVRKLRDFQQNRPDAFVIASGETTPLLTERGFATAPVERPGLSVEFMAAGAGFLSRPRAIDLTALSNPVSVCDLDTSNPDASKFAYQPLLFAGETAEVVAIEIKKAAEQARRPVWLPYAGAIALVLLALLLLLRRRKPPTSLQLVSLDNGGLAPTPGDPVRAGLVTWLKTQFVQRLLSQRAELLNAEAEATRRTVAIEEKLSQLQANLQERIAGYEMRILRLENELSASTIENRELIRSQIELLREKLAKAKEEHSIRRN